MKLPNPLRWLGPPPVESDCSARTIVWWSRAVLEGFLQEAERWSPREAGAALLGFRADGAVVVRDLVLGGPRARHRRSSFDPDGPWQEAEIARRYHASGRIDTFLGDLHSHPAGGLALSGRDRRTARRTAEHVAARAPRALMALVARGEHAWRLAVWEYGYGHLWPCDLRLISPEVAANEGDIDPERERAPRIQNEPVEEDHAASSYRLAHRADP